MTSQRTSHINDICHHFFSAYAVHGKFLFFSLFLFYHFIVARILRGYGCSTSYSHQLFTNSFSALYNFSHRKALSSSSESFVSITHHKIIVNTFVVVNIACLIRLNWPTPLDVWTPQTSLQSTHLANMSKAAKHNKLHNQYA